MTSEGSIKNPVTPRGLSLRFKAGSTVAPGDRLGNVTQTGDRSLVCGNGTYVRSGHVYSSLLGTLRVDRAGDAPSERAGEQWVMSIQTRQRTSLQPSTSIPSVGSLVLGRVTRMVRPSHSLLDIVAIVPRPASQNSASSSRASSPHRQPQHLSPPNGQLLIPLREPFAGTLRQQDIRPNSSLEIDISDCFRPGDLILARVLALGTGGGGMGGGAGFILTTAEAELGVIQAICESSGRPMVPISWKEMQCPESNAKELRKVAKPINLP